MFNKKLDLWTSVPPTTNTVVETARSLTGNAPLQAHVYIYVQEHHLTLMYSVGCWHTCDSYVLLLYWRLYVAQALTKKQLQTKSFDRFCAHMQASTHAHRHRTDSKRRKPPSLSGSERSAPAHPSIAVWRVITAGDCAGRDPSEAAHTWQVALCLWKEWSL